MIGATRVGAAALLVLWANAGVLSLAGHSQEPARDANRRPAVTSTLRLGGAVLVADATGAPLRGAKVTIAQGMLTAPQSTTTGPDGRFEFIGVAPGNYTLVVMRAGYVTTYYGARTPGRGPGVPIALVEGQEPPVLDVRVPPAASISGTVKTPLGRPLANAFVHATSDVSATFLPLVSGPGGQSFATTDDRGEYRLYGLAPGAYVVAVRGDVRQMTGMARPVTAEEIQWAEEAARTGAAGSVASSLPAPPPAAPPAVYAPVFFPASPDAARATPIVVVAGEARTTGDRPVPLVSTAAVRGVVYGEDGTPAAGVVIRIESSQPADSMDMGLGWQLRSAQTDAAGAFALPGVPPGEYRVTARLAEPARAPAEAPTGMAAIAQMAMIGMTGGTGGPTGWSATEPVFVQGRDIDGLALRLARTAVVTARVIYADAVPAPAPAAPVFMLTAVPTGASPLDLGNAIRSSSLFVANADGSFTARGVLPGRYVVTTFDLTRLAGPAMAGQMATLQANAWAMVSAVTGGRDIADEPVEITSGPGIDDLVVTFTNRPAEISGTVLDRADRPTGAFPIVVFSTNRAHWLPGARRTQLVRPTTSGTYRAAGLPPGEYYVAAVTEVEERSLGDPAFLEQLVPGAFTITLGAGEKKVQDLRLGGG